MGIVTLEELGKEEIRGILDLEPRYMSGGCFSPNERQQECEERQCVIDMMKLNDGLGR